MGSKRETVAQKGQNKPSHLEKESGQKKKHRNQEVLAPNKEKK